jgi:hypothetical protein
MVGSLTSKLSERWPMHNRFHRPAPSFRYLARWSLPGGSIQHDDREYARYDGEPKYVASERSAGRRERPFRAHHALACAPLQSNTNAREPDWFRDDPLIMRSPRAPALCPGSGRRLERHQTSPAVIAEMKRKAPEAVCSYVDLIERDAQGALGDVCHRWGFLSAAAPDSQDLFFSM